LLDASDRQLFRTGLPEGAERPIMDIPAIPELDGQQSPDSFPLSDNEICGR
jgi:hypothetical protein